MADQKLDDAASRYPLPFNSEEMARLRGQHEWLKESLGGLVFAPLNSQKQNMRILDSATADGFWLVDFSSSLPTQTSYVGTDIAPQLFPKHLGNQFTFAAQSVTEDWPPEWDGSFDLVHQRLVLGTLSPAAAEEAVRRLVSLIQPGGYIQLVEADMSADMVDAEKTPAQYKFAKTTEEFMAATGSNSRPGTCLRSWLENCKLEDVEERCFILEIGPRNKDPVLGQKGSQNVLSVLSNFKKAAQIVPSLGYTQEDFEQLASELRQELEEIGGTQRLHVAWGRKLAKRTDAS